VADLLALSSLLAQGRVDATIGTLPVDEQGLLATWQDLRPRYPTEFTVSEAEVHAWHCCEADESEAGAHWFAARWHLNRLLAGEPASGTLLHKRANAHAAMGDWQGAVEDYSRVIDRRLKNPEAWLRRGVAHAQLLQWQEAEKDLERSIELGMEGPRPWYHLALVRQAAGDAAGYRRACSTLADRFGKSGNADAAVVVAWAAVAGPDALSERGQLLALAERASASPSPRAAGRRLAGAALYRAGQFDRAAERLTATIEALGEEATAHEQLFLAVAEQRRGREAEARHWLEQATRTLNGAAVPRMKYDVDAAVFWNERLELDLIRREAEALIQTPRP
jgi:tetratricopeptide (TPR) repeat protein